MRHTIKERLFDRLTDLMPCRLDTLKAGELFVAKEHGCADLPLFVEVVGVNNTTSACDIWLAHDRVEADRGMAAPAYCIRIYPERSTAEVLMFQEDCQSHPTYHDNAATHRAVTLRRISAVNMLAVNWITVLIGFDYALHPEAMPATAQGSFECVL